MLPDKAFARYRIDRPKGFRLEDFATDGADDLPLQEDEAKALLATATERLSKLQDLLYAQDRWSVLVVLQGMDTAGKDGIIKHVMGAINPQGCIVHAFKAPAGDELEHDFLWRPALRLPERGRIAIFNRSYYEEVIVVRVHPEFLDAQKLPDEVRGEGLWEHRFKSIRAFERHLVHNGTLVLKFFLHLSKEEQRKRLLARLEEPDKRWKFATGDVAERKLWNRYTDVYNEAIRATSRDEAPWQIVPADRKPFARLIVARAMVDALSRLELAVPRLSAKQLALLRDIERDLKAEARPKRR